MGSFRQAAETDLHPPARASALQLARSGGHSDAARRAVWLREGNGRACFQTHVYGSFRSLPEVEDLSWPYGRRALVDFAEDGYYISHVQCWYVERNYYPCS